MSVVMHHVYDHLNIIQFLTLLLDINTSRRMTRETI